LAPVLLRAGRVFAADTALWTGAFDSAWNVSQNWSPSAVPNSSAAFARIDADPGRSSQVSLVNTSVTLGGLTVDAGDSLTVDNTLSLTLHSDGGLTNNGMLLVSAGGSYTYLRFSGSQTITGTGEIVLNDRFYNLVQLLGTQPVLTQSAGHTIRGAGFLLYNSGDLVNEGAVIAQGANALMIDPLNAFVNRGTLRAEGVGGLELNAAAYTNLEHTVEAGDGSKVVLKTGASLVGGALATEGTGRIFPQDGSSLRDGVALAAGCVVTQANGTAVTVTGGLTNNGLWSLAAVNSYTYLIFSGSQTLGGSGELVLSDRIYNLVRTASGQTLTHAAGHTLRGAGHLMYNHGDLVNDGAILAQGAAELRIDPLNAFVNRGTLRAEGAGGLVLEAGLYTNVANTLTALDGSKLALNSGARLVGGTLRTEGSALILPQDGATLDGLTLDAGCVVTQANSGAVTSVSGLTNNGRWNLGAVSSYTYLIFSGSQTLGGTGELVLSDRIYNVVRPNSSQTLTHRAGHTIRGAGYLLDNHGDLLNEGAILAQGTAELKIDPQNAFINRGILRAEGTGGLVLEAGAHTNAGAPLTVLDGSKLRLRPSARLVGGTVETQGSARFYVEETSLLDGVTLAIGSVVTQANANAVTVYNGLTNNGAWHVGAVGNYTYLDFSGSQTLGGTGELVLSDRIYNVVRCTGGSQTLTHAAGHTIRGAGYLLDNVGNLDNYGRILATGTARLIVNPLSSFRNLEGGVLGGLGTIEFTDGFAGNAGTLAPGLSAGTLTIIGNVSNAGTALLDLELGGAATNAFDRLVVQGALTLGGTLRVTLLGGFTPAPGDTFAVVLASSLNGVFANAVPASGNTAVGADLGGARADVTYDTSSYPARALLSNVESLGEAEPPAFLSVEASPPTVSVRFAPAETNWLYTLLFRPSLVVGDWSAVPGAGPRFGNGGTDELTHTNAPAAGFYRVRAEVP
jgi:hypothetical protein